MESTSTIDVLKIQQELYVCIRELGFLESNTSLTVIEDHVARRLRFKLQQFIAGNLADTNIQTKTETKAIPKTWWQFFKHTHFPRTKIGRWLLKLSPVKFEIINVITTITTTNKYNLCPHLPIPKTPNHLHNKFIVTGCTNDSNPYL